jgi:hypothetical protein
MSTDDETESHKMEIGFVMLCRAETLPGMEALIGYESINLLARMRRQVLLWQIVTQAAVSLQYSQGLTTKG